MQLYGQNILNLDFINNLAMINGEDYALDRNLAPNRQNAFNQYGGPITFNRSYTGTSTSPGTVTDPTGTVTFAPCNLFLNSVWAGAVSGTPGTAPTNWNFVISGGTLDVISSGSTNKLSFTATSNRHFIYQNVAAATSTSYLFSVVVVSNTGVIIERMIGGSISPAGTVETYYVNGVAVTTSYVPRNGDRIAIRYDISTTSGNIVQRIGIGTASNATGTVVLENPQLEVVTYQKTPNVFIPTTTTSAVLSPRFDYDPSTLRPKGLLIEEARTNLITYSEQVDNPAWTNVALNTTGTPPWINVITAPDGTNTADKLIPDSTNTSHYAGSSSTPIVTGTIYTISVYAKKGEYDYLQVSLGGTVLHAYANFNLNTGTVGATGNSPVVTPTITPVGNGWYRCVISVNSGFTGNNNARFFPLNADIASRAPSFAGDNASGVYVWGAQLEAGTSSAGTGGAFATSYIPTTSAAVTRNADICALDGINFSNFYNPTQGTTLLSMQTLNPSYSTALVYPGILLRSDTRISLGIYSNAILITQIPTTAISTTRTYLQGPFNIAYAYAPEKVQKVAYNGVVSNESLNADTNAANLLRIAGPNVGGVTYSGYIRKIQYYPTMLSDTTLQSLTA